MKCACHASENVRGNHKHTVSVIDVHVFINTSIQHVLEKKKIKEKGFDQTFIYAYKK